MNLLWCRPIAEDQGRDVTAGRTGRLGTLLHFDAHHDSAIVGFRSGERFTCDAFHYDDVQWFRRAECPWRRKKGK